MSERINVTISIPRKLREDVDMIREYFWLKYQERITWERIIRAGIDYLLTQRGLNLESVRKEIEEIEKARREVSKP